MKAANTAPAQPPIVTSSIVTSLEYTLAGQLTLAPQEPFNLVSFIMPAQSVPNPPIIPTPVMATTSASHTGTYSTHTTPVGYSKTNVSGFQSIVGGSRPLLTR